MSKFGIDTGNPKLDLALAELTDSTGVAGWSIVNKRKSIGKFGRRTLASGVTALIWEGTQAFETLLSVAQGNLIDTFSSSNAADVGQVINIEGHYYDPAVNNGKGGLVFHVQQIVSNGQNKVVLSQPLIRSDRMFVALGQSLAGTGRLYEDTAITGGVPTDTTKVHNLIVGPNGVQSFKARLSTSWRDAFIVLGGQLSIGRSAGSSAAVDFSLEAKSAIVANTVHRPGTSPVTLSTGGTSFLTFERPIPSAIPPNFDIRVTGTSTAAGVNAAVTLFGYFAVRPDPLAAA